MASPRNMSHLFHYLLVARLSLWCRSIVWTLNCRARLLDDCISKGFMLKNTCGVQASVYKLPFYPISLVKSWSFAESLVKTPAHTVHNLLAGIPQRQGLQWKMALQWAKYRQSVLVFHC